MVAAAVANRGVVMQPYVVDRVVAPQTAIVVTRTKRHELGRTMSEHNAVDLAGAMEAVVQAGTGTAAQIPGVRVAGKTGTAETGRRAQPDGVHRLRARRARRRSRSP